MTAPEPTVCPCCKGEGYVATNDGEFVCPCPYCRCQICGELTPTAPVCVACDLAEERAGKRRADV